MLTHCYAEILDRPKELPLKGQCHEMFDPLIFVTLAVATVDMFVHEHESTLSEYTLNKKMLSFLPDCSFKVSERESQIFLSALN